MSTHDKSFFASGITLTKPSETGSSGSISDLNTALFVDDKGNLNFRDEYVKKILGKDSISLKELYTRAKGTFYKEGQLYFKDESITRAYSLEEIVNACRRWKENLTTGSLWWLGRSAIDHSSCANLPRFDDPTGQNRVWSVDRFLSQVSKLSSCETPTPLTFYEKTIDPTTGAWRWWDVPGMEIVVPPVTDAYKLGMIIAKLAYGSYNSPEPIIFRLYDQTAGKELVRSSVQQGCQSKIMYPVTLNYFGTMPSTVEDCEAVENCGCVAIDCVTGDTSCDAPDTGAIIANKYESGSHLIKIQFHVINYQPNHWERVFGVEIDGVYLSTSTIDAVIFDANPMEKYAKKQGSAQFNGESQKTVTFEKPMSSTSYSISLSSNRNVNLWYDNKTSTGFKINSELPFSGYVDWSIVNLNANNGR